MSRKGLYLFAATSAIWGSSFLLIRVAVEHMTPSAAVMGRTLLREYRDGLPPCGILAVHGGFSRLHEPAMSGIGPAGVLCAIMATLAACRRLSPGQMAAAAPSRPLS
jgi:hypothetical protein